MMDVNISISIAALSWAVLSTLYVWYSGTQRANKSEVDEHGRDIAGILATLKSMPNQEAFHKLQLDVVEMRGEQRVFAEKIIPIGKSIARIEEFLLRDIESVPRAKRMRS